jgi:elongator complex protein 3
LSSKEALRRLVKILLESENLSRDLVNREKMRIATQYRLGRLPSNSEIIATLTGKERAKLLPILTRKTTRAISGVTVIAVMTKPYACPQPEPCAYCPGGPRFGVPQSYTGHEPAAMRGIQNNYDPYRQVRSRIAQLQAIGHTVDKIELIIMGGTFPATPAGYQTRFIHRCLDAITDRRSFSLEEAKINAETSKTRNVGITVETRPDWAKQKQVDRMLNMGVTRVELGVQNPDDTIYRRVRRTHTVNDVVEATRIMKDAGLKVVYHLMPGMPGSDPQKDLRAFKRVFESDDFKPDMIKIYPCLVIEGTQTFDWHRRGQYSPYSTDQAVELVAEVKKIVPHWIRIMRVQRDIPSNLIVAGVKSSNLRELARKKLRNQGLRCRCIRCREAGQRLRVEGVAADPSKIEILIEEYEASEGQELFISAEDMQNDVLLGYLRLRIPSEKAHRPEVTSKPCSIVRELHIYGKLVPVGEHRDDAWQHKGYGQRLLSEAERVTRQHYDLKKILVISALGTRQYYMRQGYMRDGAYVSKELDG